MPQAADSTGLVFEIADHGVAVNDSTSIHDFANASPIGGFFSTVPAEGSLNTATPTQIDTSFPSLPEIFFGSQQAQIYGQAGSSSILATTPSSSLPGPVNVTATDRMVSLPLCPRIYVWAVPLQYGALAADPRGGVPADLLGYGYSVDVPSANIQVSLGSFRPVCSRRTHLPGAAILFLYNISSLRSRPVPPAHKISRSRPRLALRYRARLFTTSRASSTIRLGTPSSTYLYDPRRNQIYLSAGDHIDVFSLSSNTFGSPVAHPKQRWNPAYTWSRAYAGRLQATGGESE